MHLDHKSLLSCRLVSKSVKKMADNSRFWLKKLAQNNLKIELLTAWKQLVQTVELEDSTLEQRVTLYIVTQVVKILITYTDTPNAPTDDGWTLIHLAAQNGHLEVVKIS